MEERKKKVYIDIMNDVRSRKKKPVFSSFSKLDKYLKCKRWYKYLYVDKLKIEFEENIHTSVGSICHDLIEWSVTENWDRETLLDNFEDRVKRLMTRYELTEEPDLIKSVRGFFQDSNYLELYKNKKIEFELPVKIRLKETDTEEHWFVGFIDMVVHNDNNTVTIYDLKTSNISNFTGENLQTALLQLYSYAYIYESNYRIRVSEIGYLLIKYSNLEFIDVKGKLRKSSKVERKNIIKEFNSKNGVKDLVKNDCYLMFPYTKENRLVYIKNLIDIFFKSLLDKEYDPIDRDKFYCDRFCPFKNNPCNYREPENNMSDMEILMKYALNNSI